MDARSGLTILLMDYENVPVSAKENMSPSYPRKHNIADLLNWPILAFLGPEFLRTIRMAFVYDYRGLLVTKDDKVYAVGLNSIGYSVVEPSLFSPREFVELRHKGIKSFCFLDGNTVMALAKDSKMYYVNHNMFHVFKICCKGYDIPVLVRDIACNKKQIFLLLETNIVRVLKKEDLYESPSQETNLCIHRSKVVCIEATDNACVALLKDGTVKHWDNKSKKVLHFKKIEMPEDVNKIEKIACGIDHTLALSDAGHVYAWTDHEGGLPYYRLKYLQPEKVSVKGMEQVIDIAATRHSKIRVALTALGKIFVWGGWGITEAKPQCRVPYTSIHEVYAKFAPMYMHRPLFIDGDDESNIVIDSLSSAFDDQSTSDFTIIVEGKPIQVHKAILKVTSGYFRRMFETNFAENNNNVLELEEFSYVVYKAFLKYLYTGKINLPVRDALELLRLANVYLDNRLQGLCEETVMKGISIWNALDVLTVGHRCSIKSLMAVSMDFILNHMDDIVKDEEFSKLDKEVYIEVIQEAVKKGVFKKCT